MNSQADKYSTKYIDDKIESFLVEIDNMIRGMSEETFEGYKRDLLKLKQIEVDLIEEVEQNWQEILDEQYVFNRNVQEINELCKIRFEDFKELWRCHNVFSARDSLVINAG